MFLYGEHELEFQDDSFDHKYGTEQVFYYQCKYCDHIEDFDYPSSEDDY
jgi:hypothetical protein